MTPFLLHGPARLACVLAAILASHVCLFTPASRAQSAQDTLEVYRSALGGERERAFTTSMQLTDVQWPEFWAVYREYRDELKPLGDRLVRLLLDYRDAYPDALDPKRAEAMLKEYTELEVKWAETRARYARRLRKVLPADKVLRFLQIENRIDLKWRQELSGVPLVPRGAPHR